MKSLKDLFRKEVTENPKFIEELTASQHQEVTPVKKNSHLFVNKEDLKPTVEERLLILENKIKQLEKNLRPN